jgi:tryptophan synthase alpha chain
MNAIDTLFTGLRASKRKAFLPFLPAGDPDMAFTGELLPRVAASGASLIEVGFPFSDPIADGPVIQESYTRALRNKLKLDDLFGTLRNVTSQPGWATPMVGMASYSLIHKRGIAAFLQQAKASGLSGCVVPDIPAEEAEELAKQCQAADFKLILLVTPTTEPKRMQKIVSACSGFVYVVSVVGITGGATALSETVAGVTTQLRTMTDLPLCVGFGVSTPEHVKAFAPHCDGIIVGTALVKKLANAANDRAGAINAVATTVKELSDALAEVQ